MEISVAESDDQQGDNSENNGKTEQNIPSNSDKKDSSVESCKNFNAQIERAAKLKDKPEGGNAILIKNAVSSKSTEVDTGSGPSQDGELEMDNQAKMNSDSNQALAKPDLNLSKVKADLKKVKIKMDANQAKPKLHLNQFKEKTDQNQDKTNTVSSKSKSKEDTSQATLQSTPSKVVITEDIQPKVKMADQSPSKIKLDQNHIKTKLDQIKSAAKLTSFHSKAAAYDAESKSKIEPISKDSGKPKKKFYFLFRVKEFNVISKKDDSKYKCHVCNGIYRQKFSLKRHFLRNHINPDYISFSDISNCKINVPNEKIMQQVAEETKTPSGRKRFRTKDAIFLEHNKSRMMPGLYKCHECSEIKLDLESELKTHYISHPNVQPDENFPCEYCSAVFQKRAVLNKHMAAHHEKKTFTCKKCKQEFTNDLEFQKHLSMQGNGGKCKYCEKEFCTTAMRKKHEHLHEGMKGYSCKHCHEVFSKIDDVKKHVVKNHASLYLTCSYCPKQAFPHMFATKLLLSAHVREKHDGVFGKKPATAVGSVSNYKNSNGKVSASAGSVCNYCQKKFPGVRAMLRHKTIAHKRLLNKHKNAAHKKNALAKKQSTMAAKQKAYNKKIANEKKIQQANKHKVLHKERTTYERKAKQAVQDKSVIERFSTRRIKFESSRIAMNKFYASLAENIAENLLEHVDGRAHQLSIKNYNFNDNNELPDNGSQHDHDQIPWSSYNFPNDFDVQLALDKRGQEIKPKVPDAEQCLYATGLGKVSSSSDEDGDNLSNKVISTCANEDVAEFKDKVYDAATLRTLSLDEKKKLLQYEPIIVFICCVCKQKYNTFRELDDHIHNNHPNVEPSWIEVEGTKETPPLVPLDLCREPYANPDGVLFSCVVPPLMPGICTLKCTKCYRIFPKSSELHLHLLECGGNEGLRPKYHKKLNLQKRIKHTMKHRMDLSVKQVASKKESPFKDFRNGRIEKSKVKYGKDYFSTKSAKNVRAQSPLAFQQKNITCFFCKEKFDSKLLLTEHYSVCSKFNRKRKRKTASPIAKKNLNNSNQTSDENKQAVVARTDVHGTNYPTPNLHTSLENGLDLTMSSAKVPATNSAIKSGGQSSGSTLPDIILSLNKNNKPSKIATNESSAMDLSTKPIKQIVVTKLTVPSNLGKSKATSNLNIKVKTPIEALHDTVQRIEANGTRRDVKLNIVKSPFQRSKNPSTPPEMVANKGLVSPKPIAPKPITPNPKQNLPKIKEVINEIKLAASNSPNLKKSATPLLFIVSNSDVNKGAVRNINSAISTIKTKLNDQISSEPSNESKELPFVARRKRKKEQPTKVVQKTADKTVDAIKFDSQKDNLLLNESREENQKDVLPSTIGTIDSSKNCTNSKGVNKSDNIVKNLSSEKELPPISNDEKSTIKTKESSVKSALLQTSAIVVPSSAANDAVPSLASTENNQKKITDSFISSEKSDAKCNQPMDRESPTLELLVSSVTQNIENFDKPSFLDDEKFALPSLNINTTVVTSNVKTIESSRNSLNFRVIIPDAETQTGPLLETEGQQAPDEPRTIEVPNFPTVDTPIPESESQKKSEKLTSVSSSFGSSELSTTRKQENSVKLPPLKDKHSDSPMIDSIVDESNVSCTADSSASETVSSKSQNIILPDKDGPSSKAGVQNNQREDNVVPEFEKFSDSANVAASENVQLSTKALIEPIDEHVQKQLSSKEVNVADSDAYNSETIPNISINDTIPKQANVPDLESFDSIDETIAAVLKGGSWRRGRRPKRSVGRPSIRPVGRPRGIKRNTYSKTSNDSDELILPANPISSPTKPAKSKNTKTTPTFSTTNVSSQLRAFRIETSELSNKTLNETLSGKSDHSNSSEVASDFGKDLASRMKERMRLSFGTVPSEIGNESSKKSVDDCQRDSSTPGTMASLSERNLNGTLDSPFYNLASEQSVDDCLEPVTASIKKELKEPELSKKHICPFCILEFAYLTNFRRHLKICKSKYDNLTVETPASTASTSQIQHLPKKDEVEESMLNLLRHQSRQNQMIKETQPIKACEPEKNFQKFNCESCHKIYFSLFKLMQHRMKEHLMPSAESKAMVSEDQSVQEFEEDDQYSAGSSVRRGSKPENVTNQPAECVPSGPLLPDTQDPSVIGTEEKLEEDQINCSGQENSLAEGDQNYLPNEDMQVSSPMTDTPTDSTLDELTAEAKDNVSKSQSDSEDSQATTVDESSSSVKKHSNDSSNNKSVKVKSNFIQKKYKELIDPNYFAIPSFGKGRGRKKKSLLKKVEDKEIEESDMGEVSSNNKNITQKVEEKLKEKKSVNNSPKASTANEPQSKRDIYLKILENCSKLSIVKNSAAKDNSKVKVNSQKDKFINNTLETADAIQSSPAKKRGRPRFSGNLSVAGKKELPKTRLLDTNDNVDVYTVSSEKNSKEITVIKETNSQSPSFLASSSPKKPGRKRAAVESTPTTNSPKAKRGKYIRVKKDIRTFSPDTSEIETDDSASFIVSGDDVIPSPTQISKFHSSKSRIVAKPLDIPQAIKLKGKQSAIHKFVSDSSMIKSPKPSKSPKTVSLSAAGSTVESSPVSNSAFSKSKAVKKFMKTSCDNIPGSSVNVAKVSPKNSKALKMHLDSTPGDSSDLQPISFGKRIRDTICPICKKKFSTPLLRNRHLQLAHGRKNNRIDLELPPDVQEEQKLDKQFGAAEIRPKFQRHCIKPLPPLKRKYQKTISSIAHLKKQKL